jgi:hypothetical protein
MLVRSLGRRGKQSSRCSVGFTNFVACRTRPKRFAHLKLASQFEPVSPCVSSAQLAQSPQSPPIEFTIWSVFRPLNLPANSNLCRHVCRQPSLLNLRSPHQLNSQSGLYSVSLDYLFLHSFRNRLPTAQAFPPVLRSYLAFLPPLFLIWILFLFLFPDVSVMVASLPSRCAQRPPIHALPRGLAHPQPGADLPQDPVLLPGLHRPRWAPTRRLAFRISPCSESSINWALCARLRARTGFFRASVSLPELCYFRWAPWPRFKSGNSLLSVLFYCQNFVIHGSAPGHTRGRNPFVCGKFLVVRLVVSPGVLCFTQSAKTLRGRNLSPLISICLLVDAEFVGSRSAAIS